MGTRSRNRIVSGGEGNFTSVLEATPVITSSREWTAYRSFIRDFQPGPDQALLVEHEHVTGHNLTLRYVPNPAKPWFYKELVSYPLGYFASGFGPAHQTIAGQPSNSALAVQLLAATNPSKPVVDLPVSFLELRELPHLLKTVGDSLIKTWAKKNLNREFGLTPLMSDALNLLRFSEDVGKRVELFKKLREKPILRKAALWEGSLVTSPNKVVRTNSSPAYCIVDHRKVSHTTTVRAWGYVRWTPDAVFNKGNLAYTDPALEYLARRAVLGTQLGLVTAWNALPWTWLADWFGNIGTWLEANRHVVPAQPSLPRLCIQSKSTEYFVVESSNIGLTAGTAPVNRNKVTKVRTIASASLPSAFLPLLTGRQVGILASLAALRL